MSDLSCVSCRKTKTTSQCSLCEGLLCKSCIKHHDPTVFSFLKETPDELKHLRYCGSCYDEQVAPMLDAYQAVMERAKQVFVFFKTQRKAPPITAKSKQVFKVSDCADRDETILRLAFFAAELDFNALVEVDVVCEKVRNGAYQTSNWNGSGIPAQVDEARLHVEEAQDKRFK
jgi:hypothetical protein